MTFPTPHTVGWHTRTEGALDPRGNTSYTYTPPLKTGETLVDGTSVKVIGWAPTRQAETSEIRVESDYDLFVPATVTANPGDVVDLPKDRTIGRFEVVGYGQDWNHGPFGYTPGSVVKLKRVES